MPRQVVTVLLVGLAAAAPAPHSDERGASGGDKPADRRLAHTDQPTGKPHGAPTRHPGHPPAMQARMAPHPSTVVPPHPHPMLAHRVPAHRPAHLAATARPVSPPLATPAPVPNEAVIAPPPPPEESHATVSPTIFDLGTKYSGDGYVYGSSPQAMDDLQSAHVPGITIKVPLK